MTNYVKEGVIIRKRFSPPAIVIMSFILVILAGTAFLLLPYSTADGKGCDFVTALFTATSATCVTGLIVVNTGTYFSQFGEAVVLLLIQIGGLGIMTLSIALTLLLGRKMTMREKVLFGDVLNYSRFDFIGNLIKNIVLITLAIEIVGAGLLYNSFSKVAPHGRAAYLSIFHSVSAFCNAGFSLFPKSFIEYRTNIVFNLTIMTLIILGGIGFIVLLDLGQLFFIRKRSRKFSFHTRLVLVTTAFLIVIGAVLIFLFEFGGPLKELSLRERIFGAIFQSVTARTAGFNTLPISSMTTASLFLLINLMFIGASPGGTGGGIKTSTFAINVQFIKTVLKDRDRVEIFYRSVPRRTVHHAVSILALGLMLIIVGVFVLLYTERNLPAAFAAKGLLVSLMFEATSAFGTVGLSTGITPYLSVTGKMVIVFLMFAGRVGPLTLALAIGSREIKSLYRYPETQVMVG